MQARQDGSQFGLLERPKLLNFGWQDELTGPHYKLLSYCGCVNRCLQVFHPQRGFRNRPQSRYVGALELQALNAPSCSLPARTDYAALCDWECKDGNTHTPDSVE